MPERPGRHRGRVAAAARRHGSLDSPRWRRGQRGVQAARLIEHVGQATAERRRHGQGDRRLIPDEIQERAAIQAQDIAIRLGSDGGRTRNVAEQRHLAERLAGMQHGQSRLGGAPPVGDVHANGAARDDIEGVARIPLVEDDRGRRVGERAQVCRKLGQHDPIQSPKEVDPAKQARVLAVVPRSRLLLGPLGDGLSLAAIRLRMIRRHGLSPLRYRAASKSSDMEATRNLIGLVGPETRRWIFAVQGRSSIRPGGRRAVGHGAGVWTVHRGH